MWTNPQETADLFTFKKKSLMENFIFCAMRFVSLIVAEDSVGFELDSFRL